MAETVIYLACSEKSNSAYMAINRALAFVKQTGNLPVPLHLRNAPTELMKDLATAKATATRTTTQGTSYSKPTSPRASGGSACWQSDESNGAEAKMMERQRSRWQGRFTPPTSPRVRPHSKSTRSESLSPNDRSVSFHRPVAEALRGCRRIVSLAQRCEAIE